MTSYWRCTVSPMMIILALIGSRARARYPAWPQYPSTMYCCGGMVIVAPGMTMVSGGNAANCTAVILKQYPLNRPLEPTLHTPTRFAFLQLLVRRLLKALYAA